ncbi:TonB-dependent receptor [Polaribacter litorisediminis]|uniref:TonB-dependent receptor n=1 Tax=Polaribacter litorisediminis TaxID=1908341 RepID=UPI001CC0AD7B|nr:TonB-dependent receptor [Polaribacter litorisediminis]UAM97580.1 TonB-dependent receptor [Polaribacter litorisediminis]
MKKISIFLFLFVSILANAQSYQLSGKVIDKNKEPLPGASILVKELKKGTSADFDGNFSFTLKKGTYTIEVSFLGYKTISEKIILSKNEEYIIQLNSDETVLDEVLVAAVRANTDIPVTFSNLSKKEIAKRNLGQDIPVLLNYMPSVVSSSDAGAGIGYTYMSVRGSNSERINVTLNGIPFNDAESHGSFWVNLGDFASSTENLQLQRGVGTSTNGSGAFGASLNILTDAVSEEAFGEISNSFGSFNTRKHTVKFSTGKINDHIEIAGRLSNISSDGYVDRAFADLKSYFLQGSYTDENTLIKAITFGGKEQTYQAWFGLTADELAEDRRQNPYTYDNETDNYEQNHYQLHWNEKLNENWSTNLGLNYTKGSGYFEQFKDGEDAADFNNLIADGSDVIVRRWLDNDFYVVNFNTNYKKDNLNFITGISYSNYTGDHFGEVIWGSELAQNVNIRDRYYFSDAKKTDFSAFAKITFAINEKLSGYADLQGRFVGYQTEGITNDIVPIDVDRTFNFFNPKFGFTYKINPNNNLYTSFAIANREPNRNDFENGVNTPETLNDFELGWRLNKESVKINTNIYYMDYTNQLVLTGALDDVGQPIRATSGNSYRLGLEIDADITFSEKFSIRPNAAFSTNKNKDFFITRDGNTAPQPLGNTDISFSPDVIIGNMFTYMPAENLQFTFLTKYVGAQLMSNFSSAISDTDVLDSFFTSDLNAVYQINPKKIFKSITFTALINNIFNVEYVDRGYYFTFDDTWSAQGVTTTVDGAGYYPQATRNFLIGVTLRF